MNDKRQAELLKHTMLHQQREQQLFYIPKIKKDYGCEYEEETLINKLNNWEKIGLVIIIIFALSLCILLKP